VIDLGMRRKVISRTACIAEAIHSGGIVNLAGVPADEEFLLEPMSVA
jgi:hypothetical protein